MKPSDLKLAPALGCLLFCSLTASAATITTFTASYIANPQYSTTPLTTVVDGNTARVTNTSITCISTSQCSSATPILRFSVVGTGLDATQLVSVSVDGSLSPIAFDPGSIPSRTTGLLSITSPLPTSNAFNFRPLADGTFNATLFSSLVPAALIPGGNFTFSGTLGLDLLSGQTMTLPSSLNFTFGPSPAAAVPEPGSFMLLGAGVSGLAFLVRRRKLQSR